MKSGVNRTDLKQIEKFSEQGETAEFISGALQIELNIIENFMPKKKKKPTDKLADSSKG